MARGRAVATGRATGRARARAVVARVGLWLGVGLVTRARAMVSIATLARPVRLSVCVDIDDEHSEMETSLYSYNAF